MYTVSVCFCVILTDIAPDALKGVLLMESDSSSSYKQALKNFGITDLLNKLGDLAPSPEDLAAIHPTPLELEHLAAILIRNLAKSLTRKHIYQSFKAIRQNDLDFLNFSPNLDALGLLELPPNFPEQVSPPLFLLGDCLRYLPVNGLSDFGIVIGRYFSYATHQGTWTWRYILWLDPDLKCFTLPSGAAITANTGITILRSWI